MDAIVKKIINELYWPSQRYPLTQEQIQDYFEEYPELSTWTDKKQRTLLHFAARYDRVWLIEYLVKEKAVPIDQPDNCGWTPLHFAMYHGCIDSVEKLIEFGFSLAIRDNSGDTPLDLVEKDDREMWYHVARAWHSASPYRVTSSQFMLNDQIKKEQQKLDKKIAEVKLLVSELLLPSTQPEEEEPWDALIELDSIKTQLETYLSLRPGGHQMQAAGQHFQQ